MADAIQVTIRGRKRINKKFKGFADFMKSQDLKTLLEATKNRLVFIASQLAPKGDSRLLSQVLGRVDGFGSENPKVIVGSPQRYAVYIEKGTPPRVIAPKNKKVMFWYTYSTPKNRLSVGSSKGKRQEVGATFSFVQRPVNHPGNPPQPFLRPALERVQPKFIAAARRMIREQIKRK